MYIVPLIQETTPFVGFYNGTRYSNFMICGLVDQGYELHVYLKIPH